MSVLEQIVEHKKREIDARRAQRPLTDVRAAAYSSPTPRDFAAALAAPGLSIIAEIKRRSPAKGGLRADLDPAALARVYETSGASTLSVVTDQRFFYGSDEDLRTARAAVAVPLLRKDFTIDPYQVYEARVLCADAVLLIVRALPLQLLEDLLALATELGLACLVEVHDEGELQRAAEAGPRLIGVNNRNLDTLLIDSETSMRLKRLIPAGTVCVAESGIGTPGQAARLAQAGYDAILVGEALVTAPDPGALLRELSASAQPEKALR
jgi:indole-3-glycerol phosphate synthase